MIKSEEHLRSVADAFHAAAIDEGGWHVALEGLAEATGSRCGQLIGIGSDAATFNIITNIDPDPINDYLAAGGADPRVNPRVEAGIAAAVLEVLTEAEFISEEEYQRHPHYQEFACPRDIPFACLTPLERYEGTVIGLAVLRSKREGHIGNEQRAIFTALAPFVRAAVRTQLALEGQGTALLSGVMDTLSLPAFICDRSGIVKAITPAAESLVTSDDRLTLKAGRIRLVLPGDAKRLNDAIEAATRDETPVRPMLQTIAVCGSQTAQLLILDVIALPTRQHEIGSGPRVVVLARGPRESKDRKTEILKAVYSLTSAEIDIAMQLSAGRAPDAIAEQRGVTVGTVRAQIKPLLAKFSVKRQVELVARLGQLQI